MQGIRTPENDLGEVNFWLDGYILAKLDQQATPSK